MTASAFMLAVSALVVILAFVEGVQTLCGESGQRDNVIVLSQGNTEEVLSAMDRQLVSRVESTAGVLRDKDGRPLCSRELFLVVTQHALEGDEYDVLQVRGVYPVALEVHRQVRIVQGRMFKRHHREVVIGRAMANKNGLGPGDKLLLRNAAWNIVGVFEAQGSAFESEIWAELDQLSSQFRRQGILSTVVLRTASPSLAAQVASDLMNNRAAPVEAQIESEYYRQRAELFNMLRVGAIVIAILMAIGAIFGAVSSMFAAIGERVKDIAVLRLLGFQRSAILVSFFLETLLIALVGGAGGLCIGWAVNGLSVTAPLGAETVAFAFKVDPWILLSGAGFALLTGAIGGILPAVSAMRVNPLEVI